MGKITDVLKTGKILVSDGAWGTFLVQKGMQPGDCPDLWSVERPQEVYDIAKSYIDAGSDIIETNTFGASSIKLSHFDLHGSDSAAINEAAARESRRAAGDKFVMGSIGPTGELLLMEEVTEDEMYASFREQAKALEKGGADAVCIETMSDIDEAVLAIRAAKENTALEVFATFTFERTVKGEYRTMMGVTPAQAANAALDAGADVIGTNCGNGMERMADIVREIKAACPDALLLVQANAGLPQNINGADVFPETPEMMAEYAKPLLDIGVNIIGGCCGTTPAHIRALKAAVEQR